MLNASIKVEVEANTLLSEESTAVFIEFKLNKINIKPGWKPWLFSLLKFY